jgi:hypothetical protein
MPWPQAAECNMITNKQTQDEQFDHECSCKEEVGVFSSICWRERKLHIFFAVLEVVQLGTARVG